MSLLRRRLPVFGVLILCTILGVGILLYDGHGAVVLRNYGGDIVATIALYFFIALFVRWRSWQIALLTFAIACGIEVLQPWWQSYTVQDGFTQLLIGTTFDWLDIVMYAVGVILATIIHDALKEKSLS